MRKILKPDFFNHPTLIVAQNLLGKFLVRKIGNKEIASMITEVEAYDGFNDKASHASRGRTLRNEVMFGEAGRWYVYLIYGMHWMLNVVTGPKDYPAAILIRGVADAKSPGKLTKYFQINKSLNSKITSKTTGLWIEDRGVKVEAKNILKTKRIGVHYAGPYWSRRRYRFLIEIPQ